MEETFIAGPCVIESAELLDIVAAKLVEIKEQHIFMSIRFTVKENLNLRQNPDTDSDILTVIPANTSLNVVETDEDFKWGKVLYNGCEGWIALNFAAL